MATQNGPDTSKDMEQNNQSSGNADKAPTSVQEYDQLFDQTDEERTKKPGSQSGSSDQDNNGRGGGK
jgi:hypothetical protein